MGAERKGDKKRRKRRRGREERREKREGKDGYGVCTRVCVYVYVRVLLE
jgi:hypothetical protein